MVKKGNIRRQLNIHCPYCDSQSIAFDSRSRTSRSDSAALREGMLGYVRLRKYKCENGHVFDTEEKIKISPKLFVHQVRKLKVDELDYQKLALSISKSNEVLSATVVSAVAFLAIDILTKSGIFQPTIDNNGFNVYTSKQLGDSVIQSLLYALENHDGPAGSDEVQRGECKIAYYRYSARFLRLREKSIPDGIIAFSQNYEMQHTAKMGHALRKDKIPCEEDGDEDRSA